MAKGLTFNFLDLKKTERIRYLATYETDLSIDIIWEEVGPTGEVVPQVEKRGTADEPWLLFCEHATFDSILRGLSLTEVRIGPDMGSETNADYLRSWAYTGEAIPSVVPSLKDDSSAFLKGIAENPDRLLYSDDALQRFVRLLWAARTGSIPPGAKESSADFRKIFIRNLFPKLHHRKKSLPKGTEAARKLLTVLADHVAAKCRGLFARNNDISGPAWDDSYSYLVDWGREHEPRIVDLSKKELQLLVLYPPEYADTLLKNSVAAGLNAVNRSTDSGGGRQ